MAMGLQSSSVYLWTLPLFHCNGWTHPWAVTAVGGTHICLRSIDPANIFHLLASESVTHMAAAPVVLSMLIHAPAEIKPALSEPVQIATGGAAPPSKVIDDMEQMGFEVTHLYGLTESYGPSLICEMQNDWVDMSLAGRAQKMARQGVPHILAGAFQIVDPVTMQPVPADGKTIGEIMLRGNTVMKGNARKVRRLYKDQVIAGFAGGTADAFTLFELFEAQLDKHQGHLVRAAVELAKEHPTLECTIKGPVECQALGMGAYLGVAQGASSDNEAQFIHLTYKRGVPKTKLAIVGKGLTYDSGGYNLKPSAGGMIELMKFDMGGRSPVSVSRSRRRRRRGRERVMSSS